MFTFLISSHQQSSFISGTEWFEFLINTQNQGLEGEVEVATEETQENCEMQAEAKRQSLKVKKRKWNQSLISWRPKAQSLKSWRAKAQSFEN